MADFVFRSHLKEFERKFKSALDVGMEAVAAQGEGNAKREITRLVYDQPETGYVRTGRLRNSLSHKYVKDEQAAYIGTNVEYAQYVEFGARGRAARPYLRNACQNYSAEYKSILKQALKGLSD